MVTINTNNSAIIFGSSLSNRLEHVAAAAEDDLSASIVPARNESLQFSRGREGVTKLPGVVQLNGLAHLSGSSIGALSEAVAIANASGVGAAAAAGEAELLEAFLNNSVTGQVAALLFSKCNTQDVCNAVLIAINKDERNLGEVSSGFSRAAFCMKPAATTALAPFSAAAFMAS